eukprot:9564242-Karenia_brevis.AAC.1
MVVDPISNQPVGAAPVLRWMGQVGKAITDHRSATRQVQNDKQTSSWKSQNHYQGQGRSSSGRHPSGATGQPYVMCTYFSSRRCGGWTSLEGMSNNC